MPRPPATYACLLDVKPKFVYQLWVWVTTLLDEAGVPPSDLYVHVVRRGHGFEPAVEAYLRERGVRYGYVEPYGNGHFQNRMRQLENPVLREREYAVLCDTDLAFLAPLDPWIGLGGVCAKEVDVPNPPLPQLEELFRRAGFDRFPATTRCTVDDGETFVSNCNGGVWILRTELFDELARRWPRWLQWTSWQRDLLGVHIFHVMQIAFALTLWEMGEPVVPLPAVANFPTNAPPERYERQGEAPLVLHYHEMVTAGGLLAEVGAPHVDARIAAVNARLTATPRPAFVDQAWRAFMALRAA
jgi:hypothetical protein